MHATTLSLISVSLDEVRAVLGRPAEEHEDLAAIVDERAAWEPEAVPFGHQVVTADEALRTLLAGGPWVPGGLRMYWYALGRLCRAWAWAVESTWWDASDHLLAPALVRHGLPPEHLPSAWLARAPRIGLEPVPMPRVGMVPCAEAVAAVPGYEAVLASDLRDEPRRAPVTELANDVLPSLRGLAEWGRQARAVGRPQPDLVLVLG